MDIALLRSRLSAEGGPLAAWAEALSAQVAHQLDPCSHGDLPRWQEAVASLPAVVPEQILLSEDCVGVTGALSDSQRRALTHGLQALHPWRKGPFRFFDVVVDTEWRSDWKWQRLAPHIQPLQGRCVLDVGCGSGYHCWRMAGAGARLVLGIDPKVLFVQQYLALQRYVQEPRVWVLPLTLEALPPRLAAFDTVFSLGVLYHRRSPFDHLFDLKGALRPGGELVLETLVVEGDLGQALVPAGRYAQMNNVWFLPTPATLVQWLNKVGFRSPRVVDINQTSLDEQRSTPWMRFQSLADFLDPHDRGRTVEGHPAPKRAIAVAEAP